MTFLFLWPVATKSESQSLQNIIMLIHCLTFGDIFIMDHPFYVKRNKSTSLTLEHT